LQQKSWHVWRIDNQLRVERDELQQQREAKNKRRLENQSAFDERLGRLRRAACLPVEGGTCSSGSHTDKSTLGINNAHINLFEDAEKEAAQHSAEHEKRIRHQKTNNQLSGASKSASLSEFDCVSSNKPWYLQPPSKKLREPLDPSVDTNTLPFTSFRAKNVVQCQSLEHEDRSRQNGQGSTSLSKAHKGKKDKKNKKDKKDKKQKKKKRKTHRSSSSSSSAGCCATQRLRMEREHREQQEHLRASTLLMTPSSKL